ncbi:hypothetical protein SCALM49S_03454 [Streptomyces californicus]
MQQSPQETDAQRIVDGLRALTDRAHARGLTVIGATLTPFEGYRSWTPQRNAVRLAVNEQIRAGAVFDAYVDFDAVVRDPAAPDRVLPAYDWATTCTSTTTATARWATTWTEAAGPGRGARTDEL